MRSGYPLAVRKNFSNPFWKEILQHWSEFCDSVNVGAIYQVLNSPVWCNKIRTQELILKIIVGIYKESV